MNPLILNRDFQHPADGWYQIEVAGDHPNRQHGIVQVVDQESIASIVNRFNQDAAAPNFPGMLIDHEHFKHDPKEETIAYGWLNRLQAREDGLYGQVRWTSTGSQAVDGGDYRFFSTEYDPGEVKILNADGKLKRVRPLRLDGLSLTNNPNNKGGRPITNRRDEDKPFRHAEDASAGNNNKQRTKMKSVCTALKLSADASEDAVLNEVNKILNRAVEAEGKLTTITNRITELETANKALGDAQVESDLKVYANRFKPEQRESIKKKLITNRADTIELLEMLPVIGGKAAPNGTKVLNRAEAKTPGTTPDVEGETEQARAQKITNRANELRGQAPGRPWDSCWQQATAETHAAAN